MTNANRAKSLVQRFTEEFDATEEDHLLAACQPYMSNTYRWRGMHPFYELTGSEAVIEQFWRPLRKALQHLQRREDVFFSGTNNVDDGETIWTCSMGHFVGLFDNDFLDIPHTSRLAHLRYVEFHRVEHDQIAESALFIDLIGLMNEAGVNPLPPMTGAHFVYPGPRTHDGILLTPQSDAETTKTTDLVNQMIADLGELNHLEGHRCPPDVLRRTWHEDMTWYGPCGIGASYTIERYQEQHQHPFRMNLTEKAYHGHVARFAEGNYCAFFGWANLSNRNMGGFLGLPEARRASEMRVVDVYRRDGDKLAENWVIIDLPYYLKQQGLDIFERLRALRRR